MASNKSYIIVGAGVFGVSTAFHLIKKYPNADITLVDRDAFDQDTRVAASWDWNKVVRADYDDIVYCKMAIESQDMFKTDNLWKPYFYQTGIYWMCRSDYAQDVVNNYKKLGRTADLAAVPIDEARKLYGGLFEDADYTGVKEVLVNKSSGWATAGECLIGITREALRLGVKYKQAEVASLQFDNGRVTGIKTGDGETLTAAHTLLCTGAYTPKLLEYCAQASGNNDLCAGERIVAGGITTGMTKLDEESYRRFASMPVGVQGYTAEDGPFIGSLPPTRDRELKWWGEKIFKNDTEVLPGRIVSAPPAKPDYGQWEVSERLKEDIQHANHVFYGKKSAHWKLEKHRICWDAFTTSSDFIISPHTAAKGLYVATCGNFHGWKFFPVLGKYIISMLEGTLEPELSEKWGWDRERPDPKYFADWPRHDMKDIWQGSVTAYSQAAEAENEDVNGVCLLLAAIWELVIVQRASAHIDKARVFLKLDNLQPSGSFKSRGVGNYVLQRAAERITSSATPNSTHFYAASGGNAGIACVHAARMLGYPATVVVPKSAKPVMIAKIWAMGVSKVIQHGSTIAEAQEYILNTLLPADPTGVFVPPFDHQDIWDGNATVVQEIASQLGDKPDVVVCSVGGGGLLNGIMQELDDKKWNNDVQVLAMETKGADSLRQSLDAGHIITLPRITSQATSLGVVRVAEKTYEYAQRPNVTSVVLSDEEAAKGCCLLAEHERMMVELTVGVNVPVCFDGFLQRLLASKKTITKDSKVVLVVCGGNDISLDMLMAWRMAMVGSETVQESTTSMTARVGATGVTA
ncbi:FAD dependent oxidoreductase [Aureobasidium pullulans]|uniref:L-serine ammonia-lyase n=2 Tax=Aureobasidium pullulans TaxID=5580 RepID=A0A4S9V695_AURPU|nr:FAD dependent oxidoreductase [Aureobasidium pullulans]THZ47113.1 FAD dependent oxidoreductase [Aureobasidium pullulans]THZ65556.1 FAD dependent oxidoreductase [Aureobasidium pullulans]